MTRVKICGLTRRDDALWACEWGADALGFVFAPRSKRRADPAAVASFTGEIAPFVTLVGVFQDQPLSEVRAVMAECRLHVAQLHGAENDKFLRELGLPVLKAVGLSSPADVERLADYPSCSSFLLDAGTGGGGRPFDWALARAAQRFGRIVLAGGLGPDNVAEAIRSVHPWGVDTASGVETAPGVKSPKKMKEFIRRARETDRDLNLKDAPFST